ncbi:hypothetical protein FB45DRAFT_1005675 [Roridomyces roridus]|uniref:Uncharacterized protein n=1 Tax=Roridomyces roridus TaxID=1738132 RepID=A0AAD7BLZ0_9AGAR|nr:hypothetical protein FB45DRAFT_1005675 [Roridomyces roridus]
MVAVDEDMNSRASTEFLLLQRAIVGGGRVVGHGMRDGRVDGEGLKKLASRIRRRTGAKDLQDGSSEAGVQQIRREYTVLAKRFEERVADGGGTSWGGGARACVRSSAVYRTIHAPVSEVVRRAGHRPSKVTDQAGSEKRMGVRAEEESEKGGATQKMRVQGHAPVWMLHQSIGIPSHVNQGDLRRVSQRNVMARSSLLPFVHAPHSAAEWPGPSTLAAAVVLATYLVIAVSVCCRFVADHAQPSTAPIKLPYRAARVRRKVRKSGDVGGIEREHVSRFVTRNTTERLVQINEHELRHDTGAEPGEGDSGQGTCGIHVAQTEAGHVEEWWICARTILPADDTQGVGDGNISPNPM